MIASVIAIGHISTNALAAATLGSMTASVSGLSVIHGFACALDSLLPQAWASDRPQHVGLWTQRMTVLMVMIIIVSSASRQEYSVPPTRFNIANYCYVVKCRVDSVAIEARARDCAHGSSLPAMGFFWPSGRSYQHHLTVSLYLLNSARRIGYSQVLV